MQFSSSSSCAGNHFAPSLALVCRVQPAIGCLRNLRCPYDWADPRVLQLRHYRSKSLEEYVSRRAGADSAYKGMRYTKERLKQEWEATNALCRNSSVFS